MWCIIPCIGQNKVDPEPVNKASQKAEKLVYFH